MACLEKNENIQKRQLSNSGVKQVIFFETSIFRSLEKEKNGLLECCSHPSQELTGFGIDFNDFALFHVLGHLDGESSFSFG